MKKNLFLFLIGLFFSSITFAQVKIGERPENLHTGSVLELESTTRALVITRATTLQMNIITPLAGALIYNTDVNCVHYYNGTEWKNLCEAENLSSVSLIDNTDGSYTFTDRNGDTTDFVIPTFTTNSTGTAPTGGLKMTRTGNNINFEVEIINGTENIQANSVTDQSISDNAIGNSEMKDNSVGTAEIINKTITLSSF